MKDKLKYKINEIVIFYAIFLLSLHNQFVASLLFDSIFFSWIFPWKLNFSISPFRFNRVNQKIEEEENEVHGIHFRTGRKWNEINFYYCFLDQNSQIRILSAKDALTFDLLLILLLFIRTVGDIHWNLFTFNISQKCVAQIRTLHSINLIFCCRKMHFSTVIEVALCAEDSFFRLNFPSSENGTLINFSTLFDGTKFNYCQFVGMFLIKKKNKKPMK